GLRLADAGVRLAECPLDGGELVWPGLVTGAIPHPLGEFDDICTVKAPLRPIVLAVFTSSTRFCSVSHNEGGLLGCAPLGGPVPHRATRQISGRSQMRMEWSS